MSSRHRRVGRNKKAQKNSLQRKLFIVAALSSIGLVWLTPTATAFNFTNAFTYMEQQLQTQRVNDTYKVFASQDSLSSNLIGETVIMAKQKQASAEAQMRTKEQIIDAYENFANHRSLSADSKCGAVNERANDNLSSKKADLFAKQDILNLLNVGNYSSETDRYLAMNDLKTQLSCTLEQSAAGYCSYQVTGAQYFDVDFGLMNTAARLTENQLSATKLGVLTIANPIKDQSIANSCQGDSSCVQKMAGQDSRTATASLVVNSLLSKAYNRVTTGSSYYEQK